MRHDAQQPVDFDHERVFDSAAHDREVTVRTGAPAREVLWQWQRYLKACAGRDDALSA